MKDAKERSSRASSKTIIEATVKSNSSPAEVGHRVYIIEDDDEWQIVNLDEGAQSDSEWSGWGPAGASARGDSEDKSPQPASTMADELTDPHDSDSDWSEEEEDTMDSYCFQVPVPSSPRHCRRCEGSYLSSEQLPGSLTSSDFIMEAAIPANTGRIANPSVAGGGVKTRPARP